MGLRAALVMGLYLASTVVVYGLTDLRSMIVYVSLTLAAASIAMNIRILLDK